MKHRCLQGRLGASCSNRAYNWSVSVSTGPFDLPSYGRRRVAFAFVAADDSVGYREACARSQQWFNDNVGILETGNAGLRTAASVTVGPNPFADRVTIRFAAPVAGNVTVDAFDPTGRRVETVHSGALGTGRAVHWSPRELPAGVYLLRVRTKDNTAYHRVTLVR
jgi:hypothetical protein